MIDDRIARLTFSLVIDVRLIDVRLIANPIGYISFASTALDVYYWTFGI
jgi:hypothetical protein